MVSLLAVQSDSNICTKNGLVAYQQLLIDYVILDDWLQLRRVAIWTDTDKQ